MCNYFPRISSHFFVHHDSPSNLALVPSFLNSLQQLRTELLWEENLWNEMNDSSFDAPERTSSGAGVRALRARLEQKNEEVGSQLSFPN